MIGRLWLRAPNMPEYGENFQKKSHTILLGIGESYGIFQSLLAVGEISQTFYFKRKHVLVWKQIMLLKPFQCYFQLLLSN